VQRHAKKKASSTGWLKRLDKRLRGNQAQALARASSAGLRYHHQADTTAVRWKAPNRAKGTEFTTVA